MSAIWDGTYQIDKARICPLANGGAASVAALDGTDPLEIYIKISPDWATWGSAILVGTYADTEVELAITQMSNGGKIGIRVVIGGDVQRVSENIPHDASDFSDA